MKKISLADFKALVARDDWHHEQDLEVARFDGHLERWNEITEEVELVDIAHVHGEASKTSTLEDIKITYTEGFSYDECDPESLSTSLEGLDEVWVVEGVVVVDEDDEELDAHELSDFLHPEFSRIDYSELEIEQVTDIDDTVEVE